MREMGRARNCAGRDSMVVGIVIVAALLAGCATPQTGAPRVMQPGDFKMLAGEWLGEAIVQQSGPAAIRGVIQDTGAFYIELRGGTQQQPGTMKIVNGGVVYETRISKGTMTFHESQDGKSWVWKWNGVTTDGSTVKNELTKPK